ncbi:hypothetical protein [Pseudomarimonas arenosa]|uniref:Uncharacterized protein n=1 Tax=Pseudomarimonas arenosa TaxID=2774145 RepID=A0AAW3ZLQ5_9GAMM|nr:hypothetical protein [Pseudomarimonas arenosa]MBD8526981.1 hypothetical protein [Pseudomarimonas arenosa]
MDAKTVASLIVVLAALPTGLLGLLVATGKWLPAKLARSPNCERIRPWLITIFAVAAVGLAIIGIALISVAPATLKPLIHAVSGVMVIATLICSIQVQRLSTK